MSAPTQRIVLLGAGGHASDLLTIFEANKKLFGTEVDLAIADDHWETAHRFEGRLPFERISAIDKSALTRPFLVAIGYPIPRKAVAERASRLGGEPASAVVHPTCDVGAATNLGDGSVALGSSWISPRVTIGTHSYVGYGVTIGHDTIIGDYCSVMPGVAIGGDVYIGPGVLLGANSTVLQGLHIDEDAVVGAGAVVTVDVNAGETVVGIPARPV